MLALFTLDPTRPLQYITYFLHTQTESWISWWFYPQMRFLASFLTTRSSKFAASSSFGCWSAKLPETISSPLSRKWAFCLNRRSNLDDRNISRIWRILHRAPRRTKGKAKRKERRRRSWEELNEIWLSQLYDDAQRFSVLWSSGFKCNLESLDEMR